MDNLKKEDLCVLIGDLLFAYSNKDAELPHTFEIDTVNKACDLLIENNIKTNQDTTYYLSVKKSIKDLVNDNKIINFKDKLQLSDDTLMVVQKMLLNYLTFSKENGEKSECYEGLSKAIELISDLRR